MTFGTTYVLALQEIRWQGQGRIDKVCTVIYSRSENRTGQLGTGFMITKPMRANLLEFEAVNDRICRNRLKGTYMNITIISTHAPIERKRNMRKKNFMICWKKYATRYRNMTL